MVFSSIPAYLDPSNWQQQQQPNDQNGGNGSSPQLNQLVPLAQPPPPPPPPPPQPHVGGIRPGSMAERARLANISLPETALKCPRCESANTKFCYFNNYSLSQPRHFCKTCRRYWTRGGALRSVPVGGGCRRNKRTKSGGANSKSPVSSDRQTTSSSTSTVSSNNTSFAGNLLGLTSSQIPPLRFLSPLGQFSDHYNSGDISLSYSGLSSPLVEPNFQTNLLNGLGGGISNPLEQWRLQQQLQQFPFLGGALESAPGMYQFQGSGEPSNFMGETSHHMRPKVSSSLLAQLAAVKMEENHGLNLSRQLMGITGNDPWTGAAWTDLTSFSSSSTSNAL